MDSYAYMCVSGAALYAHHVTYSRRRQIKCVNVTLEYVPIADLYIIYWRVYLVYLV